MAQREGIAQFRSSLKPTRGTALPMFKTVGKNGLLYRARVRHSAIESRVCEGALFGVPDRCQLIGQLRRRPPAKTERFQHATCCATDSYEAVRLQNGSAYEHLADEQQPQVWNLRRATLVMCSPLGSGAMPLVHGQPICSGNR